MSKKDKFKFKKRIKEQILQEMSRAKNVPKEIIPPENIQVKSMVNMAPSAPLTEQPPKTTAALDSIKHDLKKSAIIIGSIIVVIILVFFIDNQTGFLLKISAGLFKVLRLGA